MKLRDPDGRPLPGAWIGVGAYGDSEQTPVWNPYSPHGTSSENGVAELLGRTLVQNRIVLYARHEARNLAALQAFDREDLLAGAEMKLFSACRVHGVLHSSTLQAAGRPLGWTNVYVHRGEDRPLSFSSTKNKFEFFLPPGTYRLEAYGTETGHVEREIEIGTDQHELRLDAIDLPATRLATLIGKPAPELNGIREWGNSQPIQLKDLRGQYVLLTFWGHWSGPCLRDVPHLMKLHDAFSDRGLVVLSVHDTSVVSISELDTKLAHAREREWWGRDIPFPIALDGEVELQLEKTRSKGRGATLEDYGITVFPTTLLIDREGKIVKSVVAWDANLPAELDSLLETGGQPPAWRERFDEVYQLAPEQIARRIAPPFIPERVQWITAMHNAIGGVGTRPERLTLAWDGKLQRKSAGGATLIEMLRAVADWGSGDNTVECPADLAKRNIPGDWVFAADASLPERFLAVEFVLRQELKLRIRLVQAEVERDVIVVSGDYEFHPLRPGDNHIHVSTNVRDLDDEQGGGSGTKTDLMAWLTLVLRAQCIDETDIPEELKLSWVQHPSAVLGREPPLQDVDLILAALSRQTSLKFERQRRPAAVWLVREAP